MAGFGLPNFGQLTEAFRKAQQIQQDAQKLQEELDAMEIEGSSEDGRASIWLSGNQQPLRVKLDPSLLSEGQDIAEAAVLAALPPAPRRDRYHPRRARRCPRADSPQAKHRALWPRHIAPLSPRWKSR